MRPSPEPSVDHRADAVPPSAAGPRFEDWYGATAPKVHRAMVAMTGRHDVADDVTAEAFARAWERWDRGLAASPTATGWVWTVAVNLTRRRGRHRDHPAGAADELGATPHRDRVPDLDLLAALASLPRRQREVVVLRYLADLTEAQVAEVLRCSEGAASASLVKARRALAAHLEEGRA